MSKTRLSLFYLAGYIVPTGVLLIVAPQLVFKLLFSNHGAEYGDAIPRLAGGLALALGIIVVQIIRLKIDALYLTTVGVRVILVALLLWIYSFTRDPFFLAVTGVVGFGMALTGTSYLLDRKGGSSVAAKAA
jgi:hypothetical protein